MNAHSAVLVLAGGRSRRMGRDKAGLPVHGTTLLDWQKRRLEALDLPVYHSGPGGIPDQHADFPGPLAGMAAAARAHPEIGAWLVVPVDMPGLNPEHLRPLLASMAEVARPVAYRDTPLPLGLPILEGLLDRIDTWLADPDGPRSIRHLHRTFDGLWLPTPEAGDELINLNTPDEWQRFLATASLPAGDSA
ncbi:molybdenum cofactor guanylyltransferase [Saccharospirillum salsuginis]|uniref:Molybdenum cofactor guanylyltransferase n=1 Tax=Saccharospirillum salsuginis TaxID=418750 RepID=A0A918N676_9GAMM|nr:NTP transferase domain-containing protein [Saccharospirillum salsuginis]GGX38059.1 molybdenum cofactor guanylyltransferase [Saccharospirillum salsuginis]